MYENVIYQNLIQYYTVGEQKEKDGFRKILT